MVQFWKDVATKAPHHSRASWMKYWRRHKHEFNRTESDAPLPPAPEKKMRYSKHDDVLLAKYFHERPTGTSDSIFQAFGRKVEIFTFSVTEFLPLRLVSSSSLEGLARAPPNTQSQN
jgi:hypothetical protein